MAGEPNMALSGGPAPAPVAAAPQSFTMEDIPGLFKEPDFQAMPFEERSNVLETVINGAYEDAARNGLDKEGHVAFGEVAQKARAKNAEGWGEWASRKVKGAGSAIADMAKGAAALGYETLPVNIAQKVLSGHPEKVLESGKTLVTAAGNALESRGANYEEAMRAQSPEGKAVGAGLDDLLTRIDKGDLPLNKSLPNFIKAESEKLKPLQEKYHKSGMGRGHAKQTAEANALTNPENVALLASYIATRNPKAKEELKANLLRTGAVAEATKDREAILKSPGAQEFEKTFGKGSAQHLVSGADPVNVAMLALPFLRGAGIAGAATSAVSKATTFAAEQSAWGIDAAIQKNPSNPDYVEGITDMMALGGVMHGAGHLLKPVVRAAGAAKSVESEPAKAPAKTEADTSVEPADKSTDAVASELFGNTGREGVEPTGDVPSSEPPKPSEPATPDTTAPPEESVGPSQDASPLKIDPEIFKNKKPGGFIDPEAIAHGVAYGAELLAKGVTDFAKWSVEMVKKFGEAVRDYLKDVWAAASKSSQVGAAGKFSPHEIMASLKQARSVGKMKDYLSKLADMAQNRAGITARQAGNHIRQRFGMDVSKKATPEQIKDMDASAFVVEAPIEAEKMRAAAGLPKGATQAEAKAALAKQIADVQNHATDALKNKWLPVMQHALTNFDDLWDKSRTSLQLLHAEQIQEQSYGIKQEHVEHYVSHIYANIDEMKGKKAPQPLFGGGSGGAGSSRYFVKGRTHATLADAIQAGYDPQSTNIADLAEHRIKHGQVLVEQANAREQMMSAVDPESGERIIRPHLDRDYYEINSGRGTAIQGVIYRTANKFAVEHGGTRILYPDLASAKAAATGGGAKLSYKRTGSGVPEPDYKQVEMPGGKVQVYAPYENLMTALYGRGSILRNHIVGRGALKTAQGIKHSQVFFDIVHVGNVMWTQIFGGGGFGYKKGLSVLEHSPSDMQRMRASGEIDRATFDFYQKNRPLLDAGVRNGLNVGRISDAIYADTVHGIGEWLKQHHAGLIGVPIAKLGDFAPWVFQKLTRGAMVQTFLKFQDRYLGFGMSLDDASRAAATEVNRAFGNLGMQGIFKSRTMQDVARVAFFAPQWAEGRLTMELQGIKQIGQIPLDALRGKLRVGNIARMQIGAALTFIALGQAVNLATTGHTTFQNEDGHELDAWIPGGAHGMWFSPLNILAHNTEALHRYYSDSQARTGGDKMLAFKDAAQQVIGNKLSAPMRAIQVFATSKDYSGTPLRTAQGVAMETALTMAPLPIPVTSLMRHGPGEVPQLSLSGAQPGAFEKQAFASLGIHLVNARGPQDKMYSLARPFRKDSSGTPEASKYTQIRRDLKGGFTDDAKDRMVDLVSTGSAGLENMDEAMGMRGGVYHKPLFAGTKAAEETMKASLGPADKKLYDEAVAEHRAQAFQYWSLRGSILPRLRDASKAGKEALARKKAEAKASVGEGR